MSQAEKVKVHDMHTMTVVAPDYFDSSICKNAKTLCRSAFCR
jgi:hypothetical protein